MDRTVPIGSPWESLTRRMREMVEAPQAGEC